MKIFYLLLLIPIGICHATSFTPSFLFENATLFQSTRPATLANDGSSITFGSGRFEGKLLQMTLFEANALPLNQPTTVSITIDATPLTGDNDLAVVITDGTRGVGFMRTDNLGGRMLLWEATDEGTSMAHIRHQEFSSGAGMPSTFSGDIILDSSITVNGRLGSSTGSGVAGEVLDRSKQLSLVILSNNDTEQYRLNTLDILVNGQDLTNNAVVPEPTTVVLLVLSLTMGTFFRLT